MDIYRQNGGLPPQTTPALAAKDAEIARLRAEVEKVRGYEVAPLEAKVAELRAEVEAYRKDAERLDALRDAAWKLEPINIPTGGGDADIGWRVTGYHMAPPHERTIAEFYTDDPRYAIDAAMGASA